MAQLLLTRKAHIGSSIIRAVSWSGVSHVQALVGDVLYGATVFKGVHAETLEERLAQSSVAILMTIPTPNPFLGNDFIIDNMKRDYDHWGAIGLAFHQDWQDPEKWWCSSYAVAYIQACGTQMFREGVIRRVTPQHILMLPFPIEVLK